MTENTINADVTMADPSRSGGTGRQSSRTLSGNTINADVTMVDPTPSGSAGHFRAGDEILGRYVVESELGQGGMGVVYLCFDKVGGVKVAVKGLPPEVSHNSDEMEAVRDNFQLVSELQHPNIAGVRTLEKDAATGNYFLVMAYARGVSLKSWMRNHQGREHRAEQLKVLRQIASALDYAHNAEPRNIIHRDIKPGNVMVDEHGNAMVLDFGLAAQVRSSLSRVSQVVTSRSGTPAYKSPEQWLAQAQRAPSDQYSLGVIAYQMFSGELPFDSDDIEILKHAVSFDRVPKIRGERKTINMVFAKVLAKKPQDRYSSCTEFVNALAGGAAGAGASSGGMAIVAVGSLLVFVGICGWWVWKAQRDVESELRAEASQRQERMRRLEAEERLAEEAKRKEEARVASEKAEAKRLAEERRKADESRRVAAERAEAERKAKEEARRAEAEKAVAEAEKKRKEEELARRESQNKRASDQARMAIELFKKGDWKSGLLQSEKADQDDAELLFWLGTCYDIGLGDGCDAQKAVDFFRRAAEKGQVDAQCELGSRYESGRGVNADLAQAKRWYQTAAGQGSKTAERRLRRLYDQENAASREKSLAQRQREKAQEEYAKKVRQSALESEKVRALQKEVASLRDQTKNLQKESDSNKGRVPEQRAISLSGRSSVRFTKDDANTLSFLKFPTTRARNYYERACELARKGAHNKAQVKAEYDRGRTCGGPEWPELEAWLDWWR